MKQTAVDFIVKELDILHRERKEKVIDAETFFKHKGVLIQLAKEKEKEQSERMYSEEDLREAFKESRQCKIFEKDMPPVHNEFEDWFEQFKKK
jgi:hypothetical protein